MENTGDFSSYRGDKGKRNGKSNFIDVWRSMMPKETRPETSESIELKPIESIKFKIETAQRGLECLKKSYQEGDQEWKYFLTKTPAGKKLILVFLGLKPCAEFNNRDLEETLLQGKDISRILRNNSKDDFRITTNKNIVYRDGFFIAFSDDSVKKVIEKHPNYFRGYTPELTVSSYLERLGRPPETNDEKEKDIQRGLLFGFPVKDVEKYAKHLESHNKLLSIINLYSMCERDPSYRDYIRQVIDGKTLKEYFALDLTEREAQKDSITTIIKKHVGQGISQEAIQYFLRLGHIEAPGFLYMGDLSSDKNKGLARDIKKILAESGTNSFLETCNTVPRRRRRFYI